MVTFVGKVVYQETGRQGQKTGSESGQKGQNQIWKNQTNKKCNQKPEYLDTENKAW